MNFKKRLDEYARLEYEKAAAYDAWVLGEKMDSFIDALNIEQNTLNAMEEIAGADEHDA